MTSMIAATRLPTITAARVQLRWLTAADVPELYEIFSDPEVVKYWSSPPLPSIEAASRLVTEIHEHFFAGTLYQWGISRLDDDRVIGTCTLAAISVQHRRAELGFAVARAQWGRGYASEAAEALVTFAFRTLAMHRIEADVDPRNTASIRVLERLGFRREGYARERYHMAGEAQDAVLYGLLNSEFTAADRPSVAGTRGHGL